MKATGQYRSDDNLVVTLKMSDGSVGTITYTASGDKAFPRERVEVFRGGAVGLIENFKATTFTHRGRTRRRRSILGVDRGHKAEMNTFCAAVRGDSPIPVTLEDYVFTTLTTFCIQDALREGRTASVTLNDQGEQ